MRKRPAFATRFRALESLNLRGDLEEHAQPEVFYVDPKKGMAGLKQVFKLPELPRRIEGVDIAHLQGGETVASLVQFLDGLPFKHGYKRFRIRTVEGVDDFAAMREVVSRRLRRLQQEGDSFPDILLIDGGKGQLNAALTAMQAIGIDGQAGNADHTSGALRETVYDLARGKKKKRSTYPGKRTRAV